MANFEADYLKYFAPTGVIVAFKIADIVHFIICRRTAKDTAPSTFGIAASYAKETRYGLEWEENMEQPKDTVVTQMKTHYGLDIDKRDLLPLSSQNYPATVGNDTAPVNHNFFLYFLDQKEMDIMLAQGDKISEWGVISSKNLSELNHNTNLLYHEAKMASKRNGTKIFDEIDKFYQLLPNLAFLLPAYYHATEEACSFAYGNYFKLVKRLEFPPNKVFCNGWQPFN